MKKTTGGLTVQYVWQGNQAIAEYNGGSGALLTEYVYSGSRMIAKIEGGVTSYFLSDRLSARLTLDASGAVVGQQAHLPFGEDFAESGAQQKQHFTSYERDSESGSDYAVNRQYNQTVGRFTRVDPKAGTVANPQNLNRYTYVVNNPLGLVDPSGLWHTLPGTGEAVGDYPFEFVPGLGYWVPGQGSDGQGAWGLPTNDHVTIYSGLPLLEVLAAVLGGVHRPKWVSELEIRRPLRPRLTQKQLVKQFKDCMNAAKETFDLASSQLKADYKALFQAASVFDTEYDGWAAFWALLIGVGATWFTGGLSLAAAVEIAIAAIVTNHLQQAARLGAHFIRDYTNLQQTRGDQEIDCLRFFVDNGGDISSIFPNN